MIGIVFAAVIACPKTIPYRPPARERAVALRPHLRNGNSIEEAPSACFERDGVIWFGLGFYEGEGSDGIGGIGRWDPRTGKLDVRRPKWLRDKSITHLVHDGRYLWFSVNQQYEHATAEQGLARYDWTGGALTVIPPCAMEITDLRLGGGVLRIRAGKVVTRFDPHAGRWLGSVPCVTSRPIHTDDEAQVAGAVARTFVEMKRAYQRAPAELRAEVVEGFAKHPHGDPAWHAFAIRTVQNGGDIEILSYLRGDAKAFALAQRLLPRDRRAADVMTWIGGRRAIAPLIAFAKTTDDPRLLTRVIAAIERAAHLRIEADGTTTKLAADSDTPDYAVEELGAPDRAHASLEELRKILARWSVCADRLQPVRGQAEARPHKAALTRRTPTADPTPSPTVPHSPMTAAPRPARAAAPARPLASPRE